MVKVFLCILIMENYHKVEPELVNLVNKRFYWITVHLALYLQNIF